jgi:hypothetical protein
LQEIAQFQTEYSSYQFFATVYSKGRLSANQGLIIDLTSPNDHLGGIGMGVPYIRHSGTESANFNCFSFPSHRDGELAGKIAQIVAKYTRRPTLVILGLTIPQISLSQLHDMPRFFEAWATDFSQQLARRLVEDNVRDLADNQPEKSTIS